MGRALARTVVLLFTAPFTLLAGCGADRVPPASHTGSSTAAPLEPAMGADAKEIPEKMAKDDRDCIERRTVDHDASYLREVRSLGFHMHDFQEHFPARKIDTATFKAVTGVASYRADDKPLLWITPDLKEVVVDARWFSDLKGLETFRIPDDTTVEIGQLVDTAIPLPRRQLVLFLLESGIVRTYAHMESSVCLRAETTGDDAYTADVTGVHTYFTSRRNDDPWSVRIRVEAKTGAITVTEAPLP